ncbi:hypothetical protein BU23DRAFT_313539 [Bimuria novae-zelandiae CBS 107.79]|uniref:Uncharacterized protein n=1 Tax=Bimuria novae-zelandiae CBS 107.79 TaxID=1447943 RepID=A0A6A5UNC2_9PLEO|nr:hypothetical protein BU23DRAFT_313539 [Bimuria novae-zelandiae CBS 107.79]
MRSGVIPILTLRFAIGNPSRLLHGPASIGTPSRLSLKLYAAKLGEIAFMVNDAWHCWFHRNTISIRCISLPKNCRP